MKRRSLFVHILAPFLGIVILAIVAVAWEASSSLRRFHREQVESALEVITRLAERDVREAVKSGPAAVDQLCKEMGRRCGLRFTVILPSGKVIGDTDQDPNQMDNHADRLEVSPALAGKVGRTVRYSYTLRQDWVYVAVPVSESGQTAFVLRASESLASVDHALRRVFARIALGSTAVALLAAFISYAMARSLARPLRQMTEETRRLASGDFEGRVAIPDAAEPAELAEAMNVMARQLQERIYAMNRQQGELDAVLSSMAEGVLAIDATEHVVSLNRTAGEILGCQPALARGKDFRETIRNPRIHDCIARGLAGKASFEEEVLLAAPEERQIRVSVTPLRSVDGDEIGVLLVLQDVTELRRLERARSEFVANVSHELRTPVTSIKGYAESLLSAEEDDTETRIRFLGIIARQADRLALLVDDVLSLASLERSQQLHDAVLEHTEALSLLEAAVHVCAPKAAAARVSLKISCAPELTLDANTVLLEQALVNLIDNAVKYSGPEHEVEISAAAEGHEVRFAVADSGTGIAPEHLPRLFERFYRADRARSRAMGGTGLGLSIVKHIALLHGGRVEVQSKPGQGSRFTLIVPTARR